jgi:hypothetical protein
MIGVFSAKGAMSASGGDPPRAGIQQYLFMLNKAFGKNKII